MFLKKNNRLKSTTDSDGDVLTTKEHSQRETGREWRYASVISILIHGILLVAWLLGSHQNLTDPVSLVVEFKSATASHAAATQGQQTVKQIVAHTTNVAPQSKEIQPVQKIERSLDVRRKLHLVRNTEVVRKSISQTPQQVKVVSATVTPTQQRQNTNRELALQRSSRYVSSRATGGKLNTHKVSKNAGGGEAQSRASALPQGTGGASAGVSSSKTTDSEQTLTTVSTRGRASVDGPSASRSFFNWKKGSQERILLAKQESPLPESIRNKGIQAQTVVEFKVDKSGRTHSIELIKSSGYHALDDWTTRYVRTFRFNRVQNKFVYQAEYIQLFKP